MATKATGNCESIHKQRTDLQNKNKSLYSARTSIHQFMFFSISYSALRDAGVLEPIPAIFITGPNTRTRPLQKVRCSMTHVLIRLPLWLRSFWLEHLNQVLLLLSPTFQKVFILDEQRCVSLMSVPFFFFPLTTSPAGTFASSRCISL